VDFGAAGERFLQSDSVEVSLTNNTGHAIDLLGGGIYSVKTGERLVKLEPERRRLAAGSEHAWTWITEGRVGRFVARFETSAGKFSDRFEKGAYFTLSFDKSDDTFVIWVREAKPIQQLRNDLERNENNRRIVSGIVSKAVPYNRAWSYSMGPGSIVLGDVFTEVCDASPDYVENHRRAWMGDRWCPWSSFVAFEGR
jgi:hypothetical protein